MGQSPSSGLSAPRALPLAGHRSVTEDHYDMHAGSGLKANPVRGPWGRRPDLYRVLPARFPLKRFSTKARSLVGATSSVSCPVSAIAPSARSSQCFGSSMKAAGVLRFIAHFDFDDPLAPALGTFEDKLIAAFAGWITASHSRFAVGTRSVQQRLEPPRIQLEIRHRYSPLNAGYPPPTTVLPKGPSPGSAPREIAPGGPRRGSFTTYGHVNQTKGNWSICRK